MKSCSPARMSLLATTHSVSDPFGPGISMQFSSLRWLIREMQVKRLLNGARSDTGASRASSTFFAYCFIVRQLPNGGGSTTQFTARYLDVLLSSSAAYSGVSFEQHARPMNSGSAGSSSGTTGSKRFGSIEMCISGGSRLPSVMRRIQVVKMVSSTLRSITARFKEAWLAIRRFLADSFSFIHSVSSSCCLISRCCINRACPAFTGSLVRRPRPMCPALKVSTCQEESAMQYIGPLFTISSKVIPPVITE
mmetsp:Transcript_40530/g.88267  ORF Transcript_40530/g.88267 Transcript_40530/m.88267 type:complete len:250 (+) Transcript_40530:195-944(+)